MLIFCKPFAMPPSSLSMVILFCALGWAMSFTPATTPLPPHLSVITPLPPHPSDIMCLDSLHPPLNFTWPLPPWFVTGTLPPGHEALCVGHRPLIEANAPYPSTPFVSHPPLPPHIPPPTRADMPILPSSTHPKPCPTFGQGHESNDENLQLQPPFWCVQKQKQSLQARLGQ